MAADAIWLTEAEVVELMHLGEAIDALESGLRLEASGAAHNMTKTQAVWGGTHTLHAIGATFEGAGYIGTKTWAHAAGGATPLLILWDSETGALKTIIEAFAMGQMRTGSMSGLGTRWMAREDADELAIVGTGKQAITQVAAVAAVRDIRRVRVFSPTPASREAFAEKIRKAGFEFEVVVCDSAEAAVADAPIVTAVTRAREPFIESRMLAEGAHVNAVGAISPEREELAQDVFPRCGLVAVDTLSSVQSLSREFIRYFGEEEGIGDWSGVHPLSGLIAAGTKRPAGCDLTMFKAMGMGVSDLSLGIRIYERALQSGKGRAIPHPVKAAPRLRPE